MIVNKPTRYNYQIKRRWHLIDAKTQNFGRLASRITNLLQGKNKVDYSPQTDCGDFVVVINTKFLKVSHPAKWSGKIFYHYSGFPGGIKETNLLNAVSQDSREVIRHAVNNMLPRNKLRNLRINRLKLFADGKEGKELYEAMKKKTRIV